MIAPIEEINAGLLPLKLNTGADQREMDRANTLIASLDKFWTGKDKFVLNIVGRDDELATINENLITSTRPRLQINVFPESYFFQPDSSFYKMRGMYKQQVIKMFSPVKLNLGGFITFDADVLCLKPFDEKTFVKNGRIISTWESKAIHSWWVNGMSAFKLWTESGEEGLGVTPNVLHSDVCQLLVKYLELRGPDPVAVLAKFAHESRSLASLPGEHLPLAWTEYSLYNMAAEWYDMLFKYHLHPREIGSQPVRIHSRRNVWGEGSAGRLAPDPNDDGHFLVVQSWAGIPIEEVLLKIGLDLS